MAKVPVRTLTLNPSIDLSSDVDHVRPTEKLRTRNERLDPGGGGINVARVLQRFGIAVDAVYLAGGATGHVLDALLERGAIGRSVIHIVNDTRMSHTIHECATGREFRFVPEGPCAAADDIAAALKAAAEPCNILVASGSLPPGAADSTYADLSRLLAGSRTKLILDTSGPELAAALEIGGIFMMKPSRGELEQLAGMPLKTDEALALAARKWVEAGKVEHVAVTLGGEGALLVGRDGTWRLPAVEVETRSAVGAGDSFLAAMTYALASGDTLLDAFRLGAAAGAAAALTPGTDLCFPDDVRGLLARVPEPSPLP